MITRWNALQARLQRRIDRHMMIWTPSALLVGIRFTDGIASFQSAVPYLFMIVTFVMGLGCSFAQLREAAKEWRRCLFILVTVHAVLPLLAWLLGTVIFGSDSPITVGLVMFTAIPIGVATMIWVGVAGGSVSFAMSLVTVDTLLSPLTVPVLLFIFSGETVHFSISEMLWDLLSIVVLPTLCGMLISHFVRTRWLQLARPTLGSASKLSFLFVLVINAAVIAPLARTIGEQLIAIVGAAIVVICLGYVSGWLIERLAHKKGALWETMYGCSLRNISLGLVLAAGHFTPLASAPIIMSVLLQQPIAAIMYRLFNKTGKAGKSNHTAAESMT